MQAPSLQLHNVGLRHKAAGIGSSHPRPLAVENKRKNVSNDALHILMYILSVYINLSDIHLLYKQAYPSLKISASLRNAELMRIGKGYF